jgi:uncharacterized protein (TIGR00290 family)
MTNPRRTVLSWSSGKDSAYALAVLREDPTFDIVALLTTVNAHYQRVAMHAVREELLELQAAAVGLPVWKVPIAWPCSNEQYEAAIAAAVARAVAEGVTHIAFGDLFLEDIRAYREASLSGTGLTPVFPLWGKNTAELARTMIDAGTRAVLTCVDPAQVDRRFVGRAFDVDLLNELPDDCDPCAERGEFHSFAWDGPAFRYPVSIRVGDVVERDGFVFADLLTASSSGSIARPAALLSADEELHSSDG